MAETPHVPEAAPDDVVPPGAVPTASPGRLVARGLVGGILMGLANLVPGISGGTMLVAAGVYQRFIDAIAELTRFKFRAQSLVLLISVIVAAAGAIIALAGPVKDLVVHHRWIMYAIFIGLTLGGVPVVWKMIGRPTRGVWMGAMAGFAGMAVLAVFQARGAGAQGSTEAGWLLLLIAGILGAAAMVLPGVSGGYLLLVMGVYVTILGGIEAVKDALTLRDFGAMAGPALHIVLPVGLGVVIGIVGVSNLLRWLLRRYVKPTLGVLLGLLVGAVAGLWPFQQGVAPQAGDWYKARQLTAETLKDVPAEDWPTRFFQPEPWQILAAIGLIVAGFAVTALIARFGTEKPARR